MQVNCMFWPQWVKGGNNGIGFSMSKGILVMREKGVFGHDLINLRGKGWPVLVLGKDIYVYFPTNKLATVRYWSRL